MKRLLYIALPLLYAILLLMTIFSPLTAAEKHPAYMKSRYHTNFPAKVKTKQPVYNQSTHTQYPIEYTNTFSELTIVRQSNALTRSYGYHEVFLPTATINSTAPMHLYSYAALNTQLSPIGAAKPHTINELSTLSDNTPTMRQVEENPGIPFPNPIGDMPYLTMIILLIGYLFIRRPSSLIFKHRSKDVKRFESVERIEMEAVIQD